MQKAGRFGAFTELLNSGVSTTPTGLRIERLEMEEGAFHGAIKYLFGSHATLNADGSYTVADNQRGFTGQLNAAFSLLQDNLQLDVDGALTFDETVRTEVSQALKLMFGDVVVSVDNHVVIDDAKLDVAEVEAELSQTLGTDVSLNTVCKSTFTSEGLQQAELLSSMKALLGGGTELLLGSDDQPIGITIKDGQLSRAQFQAALQTWLGKKIAVSTEGSFVWDRDDRISGEVVNNFLATYDSLTVDVEGRLTTVDGELPTTDIAARLDAVLGSFTIVSDNHVVLRDGFIDTGELQQELTKKFGPRGSLDVDLQSTVEHDHLAQVDLSAALVTLVWGTTLSTDGSKLTLKDGRITEKQLRLATKTLFGKSVEVSTDGTLDLGQEEITTDLAADFRAAFSSVVIDASGHLTTTTHPKDPELDADRIATTDLEFTSLLGGLTHTLGNRLVFEDGRLKTYDLNSQLEYELDGDGSIDFAVGTSFDTEEGLQMATAAIAFEAVIGDCDVTADGKLTVEKGKITEFASKLELLSTTMPDNRLVTSLSLAFDPESGALDEGVLGADLSWLLRNSRSGAQTTMTIGGKIIVTRDGAPIYEIKARIEHIFGAGNVLLSNNVRGELEITFNRTEGVKLDAGVQVGL